MKSALAIVAGLVAVIAVLPYLRDTIKGKTRPNVVTWFTWSLLNFITCIAAIAGHAVQTGIFAGAVGLATVLVTISGLRYGLKKYTPLDVTCQVLAIVGIVLWRLSGDPATAIMFTILASFIGTIPTYRHAWMSPREETWQTFAIDGCSALIAVAAIEQVSIASLAYPLYIAASDTSLVTVILYKLHSVARHERYNVSEAE